MDKYVALIPVRGGSKSIPLKNIREIAGKPLVYWVTNACALSHYIDNVYVMTDSPLIKECVEAFNISKVEVIGRSVESASDTASTESALVEFAAKYDFENVILVQATSPLLTADDLDGGIELFKKEGVDSVLSVVEQKRFNWNYIDAEKMLVAPLNYDYMHRPRRQEFEGYLTENGAFYITSKQRLLDTGNRISGNIAAYKMGEDTFFEIDEPSDWTIISGMLKARQHTQKVNIPGIKMFLTDCDGCLTDGGMYYDAKDGELKKFNTRDGMCIGLLHKEGIITGIITSEDTDIVRRRGAKLQMQEVHLGVKDKLSKVKEICKRLNIDMQNVAYVGDDINDIAVIEAVGFGCAVCDAIDCVKSRAAYVTKTKGGDGAIREVVDLIIANAGKCT